MSVPVPYSVIHPLRDHIRSLHKVLQNQNALVAVCAKELDDQSAKLSYLKTQMKEVAGFLDTCDNSEDWDGLVETWIMNLGAK